MSSDRTRRALRLFERALDLEVAAREAFFERECADDGELRREVERMLDVESADGFLELDGSDVVANDESRGLEGRSVGPFRILRTIGSGGMGVVYEAEQDYPRRHVALKMLPPGIGRRTDELRFRSEIQLLARLDHPGVARVLEAGVHTTESGAEQPYFAMEFVEGARDVLEWGRGRSLRERLALFALVCDAVQHGHQQGVVHRDLKPANVLVGAGDEPKVIDFGIARAIDEVGDRDEHATRTGEIVGTLHYMAPEQLEGAGQVDTRTDVYALGLLLYELVSGRAPFDLDGRSVTEIALIIRDQLPRPLGVAAQGVPADVGWIAMRALEKEPARRYSAASELAADLRRFLADRPVEAGPPSRLYALRKLVRRNRVAAVAAVIVVIAIAAGTGVSVAATIRASDETEKFRSINSVLTEMFVTLRVEEGGADVRAVELLDRAVARVDEFEDRPDLEAPLRRTLARSFGSLGLHTRCAREARRALEIASELSPAEEIDVACDLARALRSQDRLAEAREVLDRYAAESLAGRRGVGARERFALRQIDGDLLLSEGQAAEAAARLDVLVAEARAALEPSDEMLSHIESSLFNALIRTDRFADAERLARTRLARLEEQHPAGAEVLLFPRWQLARSLMFQHEHAQATALMEALVPELRATYGPNHTRTLVLMNDLASEYVLSGFEARAVPILEELVRTRMEHDGPTHSETLVAQAGLARAFAALGDDRAEELLRAAHETRSELLGPDAPRALNSLFDLCRFLRQAGRFEEVDPLLVDLYDRSCRVFTDADLDLHRNTAELAQLRFAQRRFEEAIVMYEAAWRGFQRRAGELDELTLVIGSNHAACLMQLGRWDEAVDAYIEVLAGMRQSYEPDDQRICVTTTNLAVAHARRGEMKLSEQRAREALEWTLEHLPEDHPRRLKAHEGLGTHLIAMGRPEEALPLFHELMRASDLNPKLDAAKRSGFRLGYARCLRAVGDHRGAVDAFETVIEMERARLTGENKEWFDGLEAELAAERLHLEAGAGRDVD